MQTIIYYYTATGNSLVIARSLAQALGNAEVLPIPRYRKDGAAPAAQTVGIVFPVHAWGAPRTVAEFVGKLNLRGAQYVFAVASCGGTPGGSLRWLRRAIRKNGGQLHAGFVVRSTGYMETGGDDPPMIALVRRLSGRPFPTDQERLPQIVEAVKAQKRCQPERSALAGSIVGSFFHRMGEKSFAGLDKGYRVLGECAQCGTCSRVCPRGNVRLENGKPSWHHDCDFCGACATWCSRNVIQFGGAPDAVSATPRKHHPLVNAADIAW